MRCAVIVAVLLLVYIQDAAAGPQDISSMCKNKYPPKHCGGGWYRIDPKRCAKYFMENKFFDDAENHCRRLGSHLVSIRSDDENNNVMCLALRTTKHKAHFWIGGRVSVFVGKKIAWTDGSDYYYSRWYTAQPDNSWEQCAEMNYGDWGYWNNETCDKTRYFVCAKNM